MYGITLELNSQDLQMFYSYNEQQAYAEITEILQNFGFESMGKVYLSQADDMANLFSAVEALKKQPWFPASVQNIRAFRIDQWSDLTAFVRA